MLTQVSMAPIVSKKRTPGLIPRGRDCHSRLGSIAMTGPVFLLYTGRAAAAGLAMTTIFTLSPFVAALGHKNSRHREERSDLQQFILPNI